MSCLWWWFFLLHSFLITNSLFLRHNSPSNVYTWHIGIPIVGPPVQNHPTQLNSFLIPDMVLWIKKWLLFIYCVKSIERWHGCCWVFSHDSQIELPSNYPKITLFSHIKTEHPRFLCLRMKGPQSVPYFLLILGCSLEMLWSLIIDLQSIKICST